MDKFKKFETVLKSVDDFLDQLEKEIEEEKEKYSRINKEIVLNKIVETNTNFIDEDDFYYKENNMPISLLEFKALFNYVVDFALKYGLYIGDEYDFEVILKYNDKYFNFEKVSGQGVSNTIRMYENYDELSSGFFYPVGDNLIVDFENIKNPPQKTIMLEIVDLISWGYFRKNEIEDLIIFMKTIEYYTNNIYLSNKINKTIETIYEIDTIDENVITEYIPENTQDLDFILNEIKDNIEYIDIKEKTRIILSLIILKDYLEHFSKKDYIEKTEKLMNNILKSI